MNKHIVIIGSGVVGLCTAWFCRQRGLDVTVVEATDSPRHGCSYSNAGMIVPSHFVPLAAPGVLGQGLRWMWNPRSPFAVRPQLNAAFARWGYEFWKAATPRRVQAVAGLLGQLHLTSRRLFTEFSTRHGLQFNLTQKGLLFLCRTQKKLDEEAHLITQARELGIHAEVLGADETTRLEPEVDLDVVGSIRFGDDCHLSPELFLEGLLASLEASGTRILWNHTTTGWKKEGDRITGIRTTQGEVDGDVFVLCGGVSSPDLARDLQLNLPMLAGKGYSLTLKEPGQLPNHCALLAEARVAVTPIGSTLRVGGTMELGSPTPKPNPNRIQGITHSFCQYFPAFRPDAFEGLPAWTGLRPVSPDGLPYLGTTRRSPNLLVAAGHAMLGLSLGPVTGLTIAQLINREPVPFDLERLSPDRFTRL